MAVVVFFAVALVRCFMAGVKAGRNRKALSARVPDADKIQQAAQHLQKAVQFSTVAGDRAQLDALTAYLRSNYEKAIPALRWVSTEDGSLLIRWPGQEENLDPVLFCGHLDVAPVQGEWVHDPFGGEIENDLLYGRGTVNGKSIDEYFGLETLNLIVNQPFGVTGNEGKFDIVANVKGGGLSGQAGAIRHGVARALLVADEANKPALKAAGFLTRDPRMKERKKYGLKGARRAPQFSKR